MNRKSVFLRLGRNWSIFEHSTIKGARSQRQKFIKDLFLLKRIGTRVEIQILVIIFKIPNLSKSVERQIIGVLPNGKFSPDVY